MHRSLIWIALVATLCCGDAPSRAAAAEGRAPRFDERFAKHWRDGQAEIASYDLIYPRYGAPRRGTAVAIFVTEPFLARERVKPENPARADYEVLKLNLVQDFATGIYDYNLMTSAFVATQPVGGRPAGAPTKVSFGSQEWCGNAYAQVRFDADVVRHTSHSYFEGEADRDQTLASPRDGFGEDALLLWARGLAGPALDPGQSIEVPMLRSLERVRLQHVRLAWDRATLARAAEAGHIDVPAGRFEVERWSATIVRAPGAERDVARTLWTFAVEKAFPHRIVRWERDDGLRAQLVGVTRTAYWRHNAPGGERLLSGLGLAPRPARTP